MKRVIQSLWTFRLWSHTHTNTQNSSCVTFLIYFSFFLILLSFTRVNSNYCKYVFMSFEPTNCRLCFFYEGSTFSWNLRQIPIVWVFVPVCLAWLFIFSSLPDLLLFSLQNEYMKDNFLIKIETWHKPDMGHLENVRSMCVWVFLLPDMWCVPPAEIVSVLRACVPGTWSGCRNLEESRCSLHRHCRQKPSGAQGEDVTFL